MYGSGDTMRELDKIIEQTKKDYDEMHDKLKILFNAVSQSFATMNDYGSKEQMLKWSRPDPIQTMMDVYFTLAVPFGEIKQFLEEKEEN